MRPTVLVLVLFSQDQPTIDAFLNFCKKPNHETADNARTWIRKGLDQQFKESSTWYAFYLAACLGGDKGANISSEVLKKLSDHLGKVVADKPDGAKYLALAEALADDPSPVVRLVAMGHLDDAIKGGASIEAVAKKLGLVALDGGWATPDWMIEAKIKSGSNTLVSLKQDPEISKSNSTPVRYAMAITLLKAVVKEPEQYKDLAAALTQLKNDAFAKDHVEALKKAIDIYFDCPACKAKRESVCLACNGAGSREIICPLCAGKGVFEKVDKNVKTTKSCPTCLNKDPKRRETCRLCTGKGRIPCERCKYLIPKYEDLVKETECSQCQKKGSAFKNVKVPCPFCAGLGVVLKPAGASDKRVGPPD